MGIDIKASYKLREVSFNAGGMILFYSARLTDAQDENLDRLGDERGLDFARAHLSKGKSAQSEMNIIQESLLANVELPPKDDVTVVCSRRA